MSLRLCPYSYSPITEVCCYCYCLTYLAAAVFTTLCLSTTRRNEQLSALEKVQANKDNSQEHAVYSTLPRDHRNLESPAMTFCRDIVRNKMPRCRDITEEQRRVVRRDCHVTPPMSSSKPSFDQLWGRTEMVPRFFCPGHL